MKVAPSVLACDFATLGPEIEKVSAAGADWIHLDVMDGHFVPNLSFGAPVIQCVRGYTEIPFDVHLMISHPKQYVADFRKAGADLISFHVESEDDPNETIDEIIRCGALPAMVIKPKTPAEAVFPYLDRLYMVLVMTVEPGFGGQKFMGEMLPKVKALKEKKPDLIVEVDGGIGEGNAALCKEAGVDVCVAGTSVFKAADLKKAIRNIQL